eukprot:9483118-Pyramimonas_sp.AAC.1
MVPCPFNVEIYIDSCTVAQLVSHQRPSATPVRKIRGGGPLVNTHLRYDNMSGVFRTSFRGAIATRDALRVAPEHNPRSVPITIVERFLRHRASRVNYGVITNI